MRDSVRTHDLCHDAMLNYHLSQKFKQIRRGKFNHFINILTITNYQRTPTGLGPGYD
jgi:hypothetical protein